MFDAVLIETQALSMSVSKEVADFPSSVASRHAFVVRTGRESLR